MTNKLGKFMKKNSIMLGLILLHACPHIKAETLKEKLKRQLQENKIKLVAAKAQVTQAIKQLSDSYTKVNTDVIGKIDSALPALDNQTKGLTSAVDSLKQQSSQLSLVSTVCLTDLQPTLQWIIDNPIPTVKTTLVDIRNNFAKANQPLDPAKEKDVYKQAVYQKLTAAQISFDKTIKRIDDVINILSPTLPPIPTPVEIKIQAPAIKKAF